MQPVWKRVGGESVCLTIALLAASTALVLRYIDGERYALDSPTVATIGLIALLPYIAQVRRLKIPGLEAELSEKQVRKFEEGVTESVGDEPPELLPDRFGHISSLAESQPRAAILELRIALERSLARLVTDHAVEVPKSRLSSASSLARELARQGILDASTLDLVRQLAGICNDVVHGAEVSRDEARRIVDSGTVLLRLLADLARPTEIGEATITAAERDEFADALYRVRTVVPLVHNPVIKTYELTQAQLEVFLDGYEEYAEFLIEVQRTAR